MDWRVLGENMFGALVDSVECKPVGSSSDMSVASSSQVLPWVEVRHVLNFVGGIQRLGAAHDSSSPIPWGGVY